MSWGTFPRPLLLAAVATREQQVNDCYRQATESRGNRRTRLLKKCKRVRSEITELLAELDRRA